MFMDFETQRYRMNRSVFGAAFAAYVVAGFIGFRVLEAIGGGMDEAFFMGSLAMAAAAALTAVFAIEWNGSDRQ